MYRDVGHAILSCREVLRKFHRRKRESRVTQTSYCAIGLARAVFWKANTLREVTLRCISTMLTGNLNACSKPVSAGRAFIIPSFLAPRWARFYSPSRYVLARRGATPLTQRAAHLSRFNLSASNVIQRHRCSLSSPSVIIWIRETRIFRLVQLPSASELSLRFENCSTPRWTPARKTKK